MFEVTWPTDSKNGCSGPANEFRPKGRQKDGTNPKKLARFRAFQPQNRPMRKARSAEMGVLNYSARDFGRSVASGAEVRAGWLTH